MKVLALRLAAPLQAWGASSRFNIRSTEIAPTKSGIIGMLAAAQGLRRQDDLEGLLSLRFGVRLDQPGKTVRDFQTARTLDTGKSMPLSTRYYLEDAIFLVGVEGENEVLTGIEESLRKPHYPLYLGRRSCPPMLPLCHPPAHDPQGSAIRPGTIEELFESEPWLAADWYRRRQPPTVHLATQIDGNHGGPGNQVRDVPVSFNPERRIYSWRTVVSDTVEKNNPAGRPPLGSPMPEHSPMSLFGEM